MTAVVVGRKLTAVLEQIRPGFAVTVADEFSLWKQGGIGPGDFFGKCTPFSKPPEIVRLGIHKVHLETPSVASRWNRMLGEGVEDPQAFTSDTLLVFTHMGDVRAQPYLLFALLEPAHAMMQDPANVKSLSAAYEAERSEYTRTLADPTWVTAGFP